MMGPEDALFTARFFSALHASETPHFSSLQYFDRVMKDIVPTALCCTDREGAALGVFLQRTLHPLRRWRFSEQAFKAEACSRPGFSTKFGDDGSDRCSYDQYCAVFGKWCDKLTKLMLAALGGKEYMEMRAALQVLIKVVEVFPVRGKVKSLL